MAIPEYAIQHIRPTMEELCLASMYAADTDSDIWDFAISKQRLIELGITEMDLRWLIKKGYVKHSREITAQRSDVRRSSATQTFTDQTSFVLSKIGIDFAQEFRLFEKRGPNQDPNRQQLKVADELLPLWNSDTRKLIFGDNIVKRFKWPALNQEAVLCAFQEEDWSERIDDPLPPQHDQDPKRRLADTIKCLNRKQVNKLIHFRGDGTGEGVVWEQIGDTNTVVF